MDTFTIDCSEISSELQFWHAYLAAVNPDGAAVFGRNLDAFRDAVIDGGPGWPGECSLHIINTELLRTNVPQLYQGLRSIAAESSLAHIWLQ
ncbi:MAG: barstar family protein [Stenotrophomonas sp.]